MTIPDLRQRYADTQTTEDYPAAVTDNLCWKFADGLWRVTVELGDIAAGSILAPSLSLLDNWPYDFQFQLHCGERHWPLPKVPSEPDSKADAGAAGAVQGRLDCWHVSSRLSDVSLSVCVAAKRRPERYLLTATSRPIDLPQLPQAPARAAQVKPPPLLSQMLENPRIAARVCSPVSLAMLLAGKHPGGRLPPGEATRLFSLCRDPATGMYGMWPLAIRTASRYGSIGAVELLSDWAPVLACLDADLPVIASIRFAGSALPGSPMHSSGGHLVVVHGVDSSHVYVNDPAAPNHGSVKRRYPIEQFTEAWFRHRGAAYILLS